MRLITHQPTRWCFRPDPESDRSPGQRPQYKSGHEEVVKMDVTENDRAFTIMAELPGMDKDKINITVHNDLLIITGERSGKEGKEEKVIWSERNFGSFSRSFKLPETIDKSGVSADYKNGLLSVTLPKKEESRPKSINVRIN